MTKNKVIPYAAGLLMIVLFGIGLSSMKPVEAPKSESVKSAPTVAVKRHYKKGSMSIVRAAGSVQTKVGAPLRLSVIADTNGATVTDFDTLIGFDSKAFKRTATTSLIPDFNTVPYESATLLSITGFKTLGSKETKEFSKTAVLDITFTPLAAGSYTFKVLDKSGTATSKFIDEKGEIYYPEVGELKVAITP